MQAWKEYQEKNKDRFLEELLALLRIPSISAKSEHKEDMKQCAEAVKARLLEAGADVFVVGTAIFGADDPAAAAKAFRALMEPEQGSEGGA